MAIVNRSDRGQVAQCNFGINGAEPIQFQSLALNGNPDEAMRQLRVMRALHGEVAYTQVKAGWTVLADEKYPQLQTLRLP